MPGLREGLTSERVVAALVRCRDTGQRTPEAEAGCEKSSRRMGRAAAMVPDGDAGGTATAGCRAAISMTLGSCRVG